MLDPKKRFDATEAEEFLINFNKKLCEICREQKDKNNEIKLTEINFNQKLCEICLEQKEKKLFLHLLCGHEFCNDCISQEIKTKILSNQCDIICPNDQCRIEINYYIVTRLISKDLFEKYESLLINKSLRNTKTEKVINCPECKNSFMIWKDAEYFTCSICKHSFCSNDECLGFWKNHQNMTCLEYNKRSKNTNQELFEELVAKENWAICPKCKLIIEKIKGCNYIKCGTIYCQRKISFCYLCSELLVVNHEKDHFVNGNIFGICKTKSNLLKKNGENNKQNPKAEGEKKYEKNEKEKDEKEIEKIKDYNTKIPLIGKKECPSCKHKTLEINRNLSDEIGICRSEECSNKIYCLNCSGNIEEEEYIFDHNTKTCRDKLLDGLHCSGCGCEEKNQFEVHTRYFYCKRCKNIYCLKCKSALEQNDQENDREKQVKDKNGFCIKEKSNISKIFRVIKQSFISEKEFKDFFFDN